LRKRIRERGSESDQQIEIRLANAKKEILREEDFDFVLVSSDRESDYSEVKKIYLNLKNTFKH